MRSAVPLTRPLTRSLTSPVTLPQGVESPTAQARAFVAKLRAGTSNLVYAVISDSTGNDYTDHVYQYLLNHLGPAFAAYLIAYLMWSDTAGSYASTSPYFNGSFNERLGALQLEDTFNRADGALGTTTSGGQTWAANSWTIASNQAVAPASNAFLLTANDLSGDKLVLDMEFVALASGTYRIEALYLSASDYGVFVQINASGATIFVKTGAGTVTLASISTALTAGVTYTARLIVDGLWVGASLNGQTCGKYLTSTQKAALGLKAYFAGPVSTGLMERVSINTLSNTRQLKVYNASHPGATVDYHDSRISSILPEAPDLVLIALGHNNDGTDTPEQFLARMDDLVADARALYPGVPVIVSTENYRTDASAAAALARFAQLRSAWASRGWGFEEVELPDSAWSGLISGDLLHPTAEGQTYWAAIDKAHFGI